PDFADRIARFVTNRLIARVLAQMLTHVAGDKFAGAALGAGRAVYVDQVEEQLLQPLRIQPLARLGVPLFLLRRERNDARLFGHRGHSCARLVPCDRLTMPVAAAAVHRMSGSPLLDAAVVT